MFRRELLPHLGGGPDVRAGRPAAQPLPDAVPHAPTGEGLRDGGLVSA